MNSMLKKFSALLLAGIVFLGILPCAIAQENTQILYVSTEGSDLADGSESAPLATIAGARDRIRELREAGENGSFTVLIKGGYYSTAETITFDERDSGVTYKAYDGEYVEFAGGIPFDSSKIKLVEDKEILAKLPYTAAGKVYEFDFDHIGLTREDYGEEQYRGAFTSSNPAIKDLSCKAIFSYNGQLMDTARYPNEDFMHVETVIDAGSDTFTSEEDYYNGATFTYSDVRADRWVDAKDALLCGIWYYDWNVVTSALEEVNLRKRTITTKHGLYEGIRAYEAKQPGGKFFVYNLIEEIDAPGEYYIDRDINKMYFYPMDENPNEATIVCGNVPYVIRIDNASNMRFEGIGFTGAVDRAVIINDSYEIMFNRCEIKNSYNAFQANGGYGCGIANSHIYDINGGLSLRASEEQKEYLEESAHYAINNDIHDWGFRGLCYTSAAGMNGVGNVFSKNKVHSAFHQALEPAGINNLVEYNEFFDTNKMVHDSGCLYEGSNFTKRGSVYRYNYFHDIGSKEDGVYAFCIYLDDHQSGNTIYGNVFENSTNGVFFHQGMDNKLYNNIFIDCDYDFKWLAASPAHTYVLKDGYRYATSWKYAWDNSVWRSAFPDIFTIEYTADFFLKVRGNHGYENVSIATEKGPISAQNLINSTREKDLYFATVEEAGFVNAAEKNFNLKENSPIKNVFPNFNYDFENIGYEEEGLTDEEIMYYRSRAIVIDEEIAQLRDMISAENAENNLFAIKLGMPVYYKSKTYSLYDSEAIYTPVMINGSIMMPELSLTAIGATISGDGNEKTVTYNGNTFTAQGVTMGNTVYLPLRAVFEGVGLNVNWYEGGTVVVAGKGARQEVLDSCSHILDGVAEEDIL